MRIRCRSGRGRGRGKWRSSARVTTREADLSVCFSVSTPTTDNTQPATIEGRRARRARQGSCHCDKCSDSGARRIANEAFQPDQCKHLGYHKAMHYGQKGEGKARRRLSGLIRISGLEEREPTAQCLPDLVDTGETGW
ncbi:hypothetical protein CGRA01v4_11363 [Colletotrichum graminicola]|nr:hypothetical protein CGRA01v4_11363 [Colletotrichum graminicola]